ncbi:penicillin-binding transpeptidase domain-containing protein [Arenibacter sp. M-2]|uniref:penicillin-binding transpeptidase domain-containing protein n=1 Tax=Arenibacter sp. M-2 TaxID=3053612 RepID=UPI00256FFBC6|nr:penicillin-binding transpeptidase domain-containing protein [Arenibacter sp. M-2]MDL5512494.1 penicillin-binding transpeptidase domain-containing protein [Arenibacter sp. M-2]
MKIFFIILTFWSTTVIGQTSFQSIYDSLGLKGSTTIFDYKNQKWIYTHEKDAEIATLPASTFKILNSLIILENKAVNDENEIFKWDGKPKSHFGYEFKAWEKDTDLKTAYKNSTVWFYVNAAKKIKRKKYKRTLKKIGYGNNDLSEEGDDFWNYGNLAISPKNQIEFLIQLYENKLPFAQKNINKVKQILISENTQNYTFRDKTGWTRANGKDIGWWVGYLTTKENVYFFATRLTKNVETENPDFSSGRKTVTKQILKTIMKV